MLEQQASRAESSHITFAASQAPEGCDGLKEGMGLVWEEANEIIHHGYVMIENFKVPVQICLGGDYKFLLAVMGMNQANAWYACLFCTVKDSERHDMSKKESRYDSPPVVKTLAELKSLRTNKTVDSRKGSVNVPLVNVDLQDMVIDKLHLLLRIVDRLIFALIITADQADVLAGHKNGVGPTAKSIEAAINSLQVPFKIWKERGEKAKIDRCSLDSPSHKRF